MKKVLLLTLVMVVSASVAAAQPGALGTYADPGGLNCNVADVAPGLLSVYVVQTLTGGSTAVEFAAPTPACFFAPYLSWGSPCPLVIRFRLAAVTRPLTAPVSRVRSLSAR